MRNRNSRKLDVPILLKPCDSNLHHQPDWVWNDLGDRDHSSRCIYQGVSMEGKPKEKTHSPSHGIQDRIKWRRHTSQQSVTVPFSAIWTMGLWTERFSHTFLITPLKLRPWVNFLPSSCLWGTVSQWWTPNTGKDGKTIVIRRGCHWRTGKPNP